MVIPVHSETTYITDEIRVMLRSSPGMDRKIIAMPTSGTQVEVLEESEDGWSRIRLPNEKEGWMLTRYLSRKFPGKKVMARLGSENKVLKQEVKILIEENARLKKEQAGIQRTLSDQTKTAEALRKSYETLKSESSEFLSLKASYEKVSEDLAEKTRQRAELDEKLRALQESQNLRWFIGGGAVLFGGFIVGWIARRSRRRPSLL